MLGKYYKE